MKNLSLIKTIIMHDMATFAKSGAALVLAAVLVLLGLACQASLPASVFENGSMPAVSVALVNPDESDYAKTLYGLLEGMPEIEKLSWCDVGEAERLLAAGEASVIVELPDDIVGALVNNRPAEIKIKSADPLAGASTYSVASSAAGAMNMMQTAVYEYYDIARPLFDNEAMFYIAYNKYCLELISDAVTRGRLIEMPKGGASPYVEQLLSLMLFFVCAGGALGVSVQGAAQKASGGLRRLRAAGAGFGHVFSSRFLGSVAAGAAMAFLLAALLRILMPAAAGGMSAFSGVRLVLAVLALSALVAPIFVMISFFAANASQAALGGVATLMASLFAGGGFYPAYLLGGGFMEMNPARLNMLLTGWAAEDGFPSAQALACGALALVCLGASAIAWHKEA